MTAEIQKDGEVISDEKTNNWEEELFFKLKEIYPATTNYTFSNEIDFASFISQELKQFISDLLKQEKIKWLEALPKERKNPLRNDFVDGYDNGWNDCLKEIKQQLTK
jgi:hypothetical protein